MDRDNNFKQNEFDEVSLVLTPPASTMLSALVGDWPAHIEGQDKEGFLCEIIKQCCAGLAYMHREGVMHRDVKPDNVGIITLQPPRIVLIDLGHSEKCATSTDHMKGTIRYLAPEILYLKKQTSDGYYDNKVDIWALGVTAFEMFAQRRVTCTVAAEENRAWLEQELTPPADSQYGSFICLIKRMLEWNPYMRINAYGALTALGDPCGSSREGKRKQQQQVDISGLKERLNRCI